MQNRSIWILMSLKKKLWMMIKVIHRLSTLIFSWRTRKIDLKVVSATFVLVYFLSLNESTHIPRTVRLWNSLHIECFPLTYDLSGFKPRINRHLLTLCSVCFNLFVLLFFLTPCLVVAIQPCLKKQNKKFTKIAV